MGGDLQLLVRPISALRADRSSKKLPREPPLCPVPRLRHHNRHVAGRIPVTKTAPLAPDRCAPVAALLGSSRSPVKLGQHDWVGAAASPPRVNSILCVCRWRRLYTWGCSLFAVTESAWAADVWRRHAVVYGQENKAPPGRCRTKHRTCDPPPPPPPPPPKLPASPSLRHVLYCHGGIRCGGFRALFEGDAAAPTATSRVLVAGIFLHGGFAVLGQLGCFLEGLGRAWAWGGDGKDRLIARGDLD